MQSSSFFSLLFLDKFNLQSGEKQYLMLHHHNCLNLPSGEIENIKYKMVNSARDRTFLLQLVEIVGQVGQGILETLPLPRVHDDGVRLA